jgi:hypothetical protein
MALISRVGWINNVLRYNDVDVYDEIRSTKNVKWEVIHKPIGYGHEDIYIQVDDSVFECVDLWFKYRMDHNEYAGMALHEFLDKVCGSDQRNLQNLLQRHHRS